MSQHVFVIDLSIDLDMFSRGGGESRNERMKMSLPVENKRRENINKLAVL